MLFLPDLLCSDLAKKKSSLLWDAVNSSQDLIYSLLLGPRAALFFSLKLGVLISLGVQKCLEFWGQENGILEGRCQSQRWQLGSGSECHIPVGDRLKFVRVPR